jgi:hypothetical protein
MLLKSFGKANSITCLNTGVYKTWNTLEPTWNPAKNNPTSFALVLQFCLSFAILLRVFGFSLCLYNASIFYNFVEAIYSMHV